MGDRQSYCVAVLVGLLCSGMPLSAPAKAQLPAQARDTSPRMVPAPDTSAWSAETRQLWREALASAARRSGLRGQRVGEDSARLASLTLRTVAVPGFAMQVSPAWEAAADSALRVVAGPLRDLQPLPPLVMAAVPERLWPVPVRDDRAYGTSAGPIYFVPSGRPSPDTLVMLANRVMADAVKRRLEPSPRGPSPNPPGTVAAGRALSSFFVSFTLGGTSGLHRRAGEAMRSSGREGWRECAAGDHAKCLRALIPTADDSVSRFFGPRDYRAHVLRDTFPLEVNVKRRCLSGDDAACEAWVRKYELTPDLELPREALLSLTSLALQPRGALSRIQAPAAPDMRPGPVAALLAVSGVAPESLARQWRDSIVAAQRNSHESDGRTALLAAPWLIVFGLAAIGGRRDAK
jgi:hypothetical protein